MFACHILFLSTVDTVVVCNPEKQSDSNESANMCLKFIVSSLKLKVPRSASISILGGGVILKLKSFKVPRSA